MFKEYLAKDLDRRTQANPRFSLRAYSKCLGLSASTVSEVISGKRQISRKRAHELVAKMRYLSPREKEACLKQLSSSGASQTDVKLTVFEKIATWYHFAILNLAKLGDMEYDPAAVGNRLGIDTSKAKLALEVLSDLGLIKNENGKMLRTGKDILVEQSVPSEAIKGFHIQMLQKAMESIEFHSMEQRIVSGTTFVIDPKNLKSFQQRLSRFLKASAKKMGEGSPSEVYHLSAQLFPLEKKS